LNQTTSNIIANAFNTLTLKIATFFVNSILSQLPVGIYEKKIVIVTPFNLLDKKGFFLYEKKE